MPGSTTTPGHPGARDCALRRFAFRYTDSVGTRNQFSIVAQWLACTYPCRRFADILADACARLGADVVRYSFIVVDLHHLLLAGLPAHPCENAKALGFRVSLYPSQGTTKPIQRDLKGCLFRASHTPVFSHGLDPQQSAGFLQSSRSNRDQRSGSVPIRGSCYNC
jgi:hypothetical protein